MNTKRQIADTFLTLIQKKNIDKITIKDIVDSCGITRQSFYYHFQDIFDLVEWVMTQESQRALENTLNAPTRTEAVKHLIQMSYDSNKIMLLMLNSKQREIVERILIKTTRSYLLHLYENTSPVILPKYELETALDFYSFAIAGFMTGLCRRKDTDIDRAAQQLLRLIDGEITLPGKT